MLNKTIMSLNVNENLLLMKFIFIKFTFFTKINEQIFEYFK